MKFDAQRIVPLLLTTVQKEIKLIISLLQQSETESELRLMVLHGNLKETTRLLEADKDILQNMEKV